jgi:hypothetical protein
MGAFALQGQAAPKKECVAVKWVQVDDKTVCLQRDSKGCTKWKQKTVEICTQWKK